MWVIQCGIVDTQDTAEWVAQCERVGRGVQALQYLSRYLCRGVISNRHLIGDDGERITFRYQDGETKRLATRTLPGEDFMALLLQHVLPKGLRRARDYGFLQGNAQTYPENRSMGAARTPAGNIRTEQSAVSMPALSWIHARDPHDAAARAA